MNFYREGFFGLIGAWLQKMADKIGKLAFFAFRFKKI